MRSIIAVTAITALVIGLPAHSQWKQVPDKSIPRSTTGEPDLMAPVPRAADGKPDLTGVWLADTDPPPEGVDFVEGDLQIPRHLINVMADLEPGEVEMKPWVAELWEQRIAGQFGQYLDSPLAYCKPWTVTHLTANILPYKIVQTPDLILILNEQDTVFRQIFLDGREPVEDPLPRWLGYSTGRWDDDELVVDTIGFNDEGWLDASGHAQSESLHLIERFRRRDTGHLEIETTVDDPGAYSKPFSYTVTATVMADDDLLEYFCTDNEISSDHYQ